MENINDFIKRIKWSLIIYFILIINLLYLITNNWSINILVYILAITYLGFISAYLISKYYFFENETNHIGIIASSFEDFINLKKSLNAELIEDMEYRKYHSNKSFKIKNNIYHAIINKNDCDGIRISNIIETDLAYTNPEYDKIKYILSYLITSNKNPFFK